MENIMEHETGLCRVKRIIEMFEVGLFIIDIQLTQGGLRVDVRVF